MTVTDGRVQRAQTQRESRRAEILDTALEVFARKGYHQTRISDVIEEAGIARGTFYLYFESKSAIFLELLERLLERLRDSVVGVETGPDAPPFEEQLEEAVHRVLETIVSNRLLTTIIIREAVGLDEEVDGKLRKFYRSILEYIREALENGQQMGIVRDDLDTKVAATCILGAFKQVMEQQVWLDVDRDVDVHRLVRGLLDAYLRGVVPPR